MNFPFDLSAVDTAMVVGIAGLVAHWIRKVNKSFATVEQLRWKTDSELQVLRSMLEEHVKLSDKVWEMYGARLARMEIIPPSGGRGN